MFRKRRRLAFLAIGGLGLLAAIAPGLAAGIAVPTGSNVPAAGQGTVAVQGFIVTGIDWTISGDGDVTEVTFTITREDSDAGAVVTGPGGNAVVRIRLESDDEPDAGWVDCDVTGTAGAADCDTSASGDTMPAEDLDRVNIIAFDSTS